MTFVAVTVFVTSFVTVLVTTEGETVKSWEEDIIMSYSFSVGVHSRMRDLFRRLCLFCVGFRSGMSEMQLQNGVVVIR